jgi:hypothetical protein
MRRLDLTFYRVLERFDEPLTRRWAVAIAAGLEGNPVKLDLQASYQEGRWRNTWN